MNSAGAQNASGMASGNLSAEKLDTLVAPIALYPDPLLAQMLPASAYPLEVVSAARWLQANARLKQSDPTSFENELAQQHWDASIKALVEFPDALKKLNEDLDWTTQLGEAFLAQPKDVMDAIQAMRDKAVNAGTLKTTPQQTVSESGGAVQIAPTNPEVIYVPSYNPQQAYSEPASSATYVSNGSSGGSSSAAMAATGALSFGAGVATGAVLNSAVDWHSGGIYYPPGGYGRYGGYGGYGGYGHYGNTNISGNDVNINSGNRNTAATNRQNEVQNRQGGQNTVAGSNRQQMNSDRGNQQWNYNPQHRQGVGYNNQQLTNRYGQGSQRGAGTSAGGGDRGWSSQQVQQSLRQGENRQQGTGGAQGGGFTGRGSSAQSASYRGQQSRGQQSGANRSAQSRAGMGGAGRSGYGAGGQRESGAFSGMGSGSGERASSTRGASSRGGRFRR